MILLQFNHTRLYYAKPHDSTEGVGLGFYLFAFLFLLFIAGGVAKAFWDDRKWRGKVYNLKDRKRNLT